MFEDKQLHSRESRYNLFRTFYRTRWLNVFIVRLYNVSRNVLILSTKVNPFGRVTFLVENIFKCCQHQFERSLNTQAKVTKYLSRAVRHRIRIASLLSLLASEGKSSVSRGPSQNRSCFACAEQFLETLKVIPFVKYRARLSNIEQQERHWRIKIRWQG